MSGTSKSLSQGKSSSNIGSKCPPTALSPSILTAEDVTDPRQIPTALSNSVNTAIGGTPSDFELNAGLSDTSAGSGRVNSNMSEPKTAKSPTSPELLMNDLRRGSLFGRQTKSLTTEGPESVTNITFSSNNNMSTASEESGGSLPISSENSRKKSKFFKKKEQKQANDAKSVPSRKSIKSGKAKKGIKDAYPRVAGTSEKSQKLSRKSRKLGASAPVNPNSDISTKSTKSMKSKKTEKSEKLPAVGQSRLIRKLDNLNEKDATGVTKPPASDKFVGRGHSTSRKPPTQSMYNFPGTGRCARRTNPVAPPVPKLKEEAMKSHCVYDVAQLPPAQRRIQTAPRSAPMEHSLHSNPRNSLFNTRRQGIGNAPKLERSFAPTTETAATTGNKIVVMGVTPDGKTTIQMTIDMQVVAGEALNGTDGKPVDLIPKKILVAGKEYPLDPKYDDKSKKDQKSL